jgi:hypothetical protein
MESAHIYHDALRIEGTHPEFCLLLLPGEGSTPWLAEPAFWRKHSVGAIPKLCKGGRGTEALGVLLAD